MGFQYQRLYRNILESIIRGLLESVVKADTETLVTNTGGYVNYIQSITKGLLESVTSNRPIHRNTWASNIRGYIETH